MSAVDVAWLVLTSVMLHSAVAAYRTARQLRDVGWATNPAQRDQIWARMARSTKGAVFIWFGLTAIFTASRWPVPLDAATWFGCLLFSLSATGRGLWLMATVPPYQPLSERLSDRPPVDPPSPE